MERMPPFGPDFSGYVELPYLLASVTVGDALDAMVAARRAGVIVKAGEHHYLHMARFVLGSQVHPRDTLGGVMSVTEAPYLPIVETGRFLDSRGLKFDYGNLVRHGVITLNALPPARPRLGGLIVNRRDDFAKLLAGRLYSVDDLTAVVTKCVCTAGDRVLPEQLINGLCPYDQLPVDCGGGI
jgi:hypothetical protein